MTGETRMTPLHDIDEARAILLGFGMLVKARRRATPSKKPTPRARHMGCRELAAIIGVSHDHISLVEQGRMILQDDKHAALVAWLKQGAGT